MSKRCDLLGKVFGKLTVVEFVGSKKTHAVWKCICDCGNTLDATASNLKSGNTTKCVKCRNNIIHGYTKHRLYKRWTILHDKEVLCEHWTIFQNFIDDVFSTFEEGYSLRRVDNTLLHSPSNSHWCKPRVIKGVLGEKVNFKLSEKKKWKS